MTSSEPILEKNPAAHVLTPWCRTAAQVEPGAVAALLQPAGLEIAERPLPSRRRAMAVWGDASCRPSLSACSPFRRSPSRRCHWEKPQDAICWTWRRRGKGEVKGAQSGLSGSHGIILCCTRYTGI